MRNSTPNCSLHRFAPTIFSIMSAQYYPVALCDAPALSLQMESQEFVPYHDPSAALWQWVNFDLCDV